MHGKETPETKQTLKMGCDIYRKCHSSLARHDKHIQLHLQIDKLIYINLTRIWLQLTLPQTRRNPGVVLHVKTQRRKFNTARPVGISDNIGGPQVGERKVCRETRL